MCKRIFALFALAISLFGTQCWASTCSPTPVITSPSLTSPSASVAGPSCTNTFSPTDTTGTYDFSGTGDGIITVKFVTVLTTFTLTATVNHTIDPLDPNEFPAGPNGVPVKGTDYKGLINLTLSYLTFRTIDDPAFGHAPGDSTTITEDILTGYSSSPTAIDPTMDGSTPGLSSVVALDEPQAGDTYCPVSPSPGQTFSAAQVKVIEVTFQLFMFSGVSCTGTGTPLRDKTARFSLSMTDTSGNIVFPPLLDKEEANKFHWDNKDGLNEFDLSTVGLAPGRKWNSNRRALGCYRSLIPGESFPEFAWPRHSGASLRRSHFPKAQGSGRADSGFGRAAPAVQVFHLSSGLSRVPF